MKKFDNFFILSAFYDETENKPKNAIEKKGHLSTYLDKEKSFLYLGKKSELTYAKLKDYAKNFLANQNFDFMIDPISFVSENISLKQLLKAFFEPYFYHKYFASQSFLLSETKLAKRKAAQKKLDIDLTLLNSKDKKLVKETLEKLDKIGATVGFVRNLQITPPNFLNSELLAEKIEQDLKTAKLANLKCKILTKKEILAKKMGLLLSVNQGSMYEPRLVEINYHNGKKNSPHLVIVGKGITFDSGGYSLKPASYMVNMKYDMSGAAISYGVIKLAAQLNLKVNLSVVLPLTDNRINGDASTPDAVFVSYSGKSVEVNNTDAEGRLILADGITYALKDLKADKIITIATLTGAILTSLGHTFTGTFASDCKFFDQFQQAAKSAEELIWRMPFHSDFSREITKSHVADLKNTDLTGKGGSSSAAEFLKQFSADKPFIHLDIAGTAYKEGIPTGIMVKTLLKLVENWDKPVLTEKTCPSQK